MKFEEATEKHENSEPLDFCIWRKVWPDNWEDGDCRCLMKSYDGFWEVYDHPDSETISTYKLSQEDIEADDWICS